MSVFNTIRQVTASRSSYDGLSLQEATITNATRPASTAQPEASIFQSLLEVAVQATRGKLLGNVESTLQLVAAANTRSVGAGLDDRELMLEHIVTTLANLGNESVVGKSLGNALISVLWGDLQHPPSSLMGKANQHRSVDGSNNNPFLPTLGAAGQPYARSVTSTTPRPTNLPDAGVVFDMLLRRDGNVEHPSQISSLLFSFANIIIHDIFWTDSGKAPEHDPCINKHSSYLNLETVYGADPISQAAVRTHSNGMLHKDCIADYRLVAMNPATTALVYLFARNHNLIAKRLFEINDGGHYKDPATLDEAALKEQDETIFQKARLVNCGTFVNAILQSYIKSILNQPAEEWYLNPLTDIQSLGGKVPLATGNSVSAEFSVLYRWHSATAVADEQWMDDLFTSIFPGKTADDITTEDFKVGVHKYFMKNFDLKNPSGWEPHGWKRNPDGSLDDGDLAKALQDATKNVASAIRARGTPAWMRPIDILGILQARNEWALCTLNEFRSYLGLKTYSSFREWNPDPKIADAAEALYGHVDNLELFPGLHAEQSKPSMPGSGLCPSYTVSRAILSDAANLVRNDRHFTSDFSTSVYTTYGYQYAQAATPGSYGGFFGKLLFENLPRHYSSFNSVYALFPFNTPDRMREILEAKGVAAKYDFNYPKPARHWAGVNSYSAVKQVMDDSSNFVVPYANNIVDLSGGNFVMGEDQQSLHGSDRALLARAFMPLGYDEEIRSFFRPNTERIIRERSLPFVGGNTFILDIVKDVCNVVPAMWVAERFGIPLRGDLPENNVSKQLPFQIKPMGITAQEFYKCLAVQFAYIFMSYDFMSVSGWALREGAQETAKTIRALLQWRLSSISPMLLPVTNLLQMGSNMIGGSHKIKPSDASLKMYAEFLKSPKTALQNSHGLMVSSTATQSAQIALIVELYLQPERSVEKKRIAALAKVNTKDADDELLGYALEALRLSSMAPVCPRYVKADKIVVEDGVDSNGEKRNVTLRRGDGVFASLIAAGMDPTVFPEPSKIDPFRPRAKYMVFGDGMHVCLGAAITYHSLPSMMRSIFALPNLRLAPGPMGKMTAITHEMPGGTSVRSFIDRNGSEWPFPITLSVLYDSAELTNGH